MDATQSVETNVPTRSVGTRNASNAVFYFAMPLLIVGFYGATYFVMRWQHVLVRTTSYYADRVGRLYADSHVRRGMHYGDSRAERLISNMSAPASFVFHSLCLLESEVRNLLFPIVRTSDGEVDSFLGVNTHQYFGFRN